MLLRMTTRICHLSSAVELGERLDVPPRIDKFPRNPAKYVMVPANARKRHPVIEQRMLDVAAFAETFPFNRVEAGDRALGIITSGVAYQYTKEVFPSASILHLGMTWPLPERLIRGFAASVDRLIVIEELDPFIEEAVRLLGIPAEGKTIFPLCGEFDPRVVRECAVKAGLLPPSAHIPLADATPDRCRPGPRCSAPAARTAAPSTCSAS